MIHEVTKEGWEHRLLPETEEIDISKWAEQELARLSNVLSEKENLLYDPSNGAEVRKLTIENLNSFMKDVCEPVQDLLREYSSVLPSRQGAAMQRRVEKFSAGVESLKNKALPGGRFSFRQKPQGAALSKSTSDAVVQVERSVCTTTSKEASEVPPSCSFPSIHQESDKCATNPGNKLDQCDCLTIQNTTALDLDGDPVFSKEKISNLHDTVAICGPPENFTKNSDVSIQNLVDSEVYLFEIFSAARLHNLKRCTIWLGAIETSILISECENCVLLFGCRQLRVYSCQMLDIYYEVVSKPIIERSLAIRVAPLLLGYPQQQEQLGILGLNCELRSEGPRNWCDIQDFDWHKKQASPNWSIIPLENRISSTWKDNMVSIFKASNELPIPENAVITADAVSGWSVIGLPRLLNRVQRG